MANPLLNFTEQQLRELVAYCSAVCDVDAARAQRKDADQIMAVLLRHLRDMLTAGRALDDIVDWVSTSGIPLVSTLPRVVEQPSYLIVAGDPGRGIPTMVRRECGHCGHHQVTWVGGALPGSHLCRRDGLVTEVVWT